MIDCIHNVVCEMANQDGQCPCEHQLSRLEMNSYSGAPITVPKRHAHRFRWAGEDDMTTPETQARPPEYGGATGSALITDDGVQSAIARAVAPLTPFSVGQVLDVLRHIESVDLALTAIDYGLRLNLDPMDAVRAIEQNAGIHASGMSAANDR